MEKIYKIFLAEDDEILGKMYCQLLEKNLNVEVTHFLDGKRALEAVGRMKYDVYILDKTLPNVDGVSIGKRIRALYPTTFIMFLTGAGSFGDMQESYDEGGADYFITKQPDHFQKLILKLKAIIRRIKFSDKIIPDMYKVGSCTLDPQRRELTCGEIVIRFPEQEYKIFECLVKYQQEIVTREMLMNTVWGKEDKCTDHNLNVHVSRLNKKLNSCGGMQIFSTKGKGYRLFIY